MANETLTSADTSSRAFDETAYWDTLSNSYIRQSGGALSNEQRQNARELTGPPTRVINLTDGTAFSVSSQRRDESRVWNNRLHEKGARPSLGRPWIGQVPGSSGGGREDVSSSSSVTGSSLGTRLSEPSRSGESPLDPIHESERNDLSSPFGSGLYPRDLLASENAPCAEQGRELINLALSSPEAVTPYTPQTTREGRSTFPKEQHTPETKQALEYGRTLAYHAMESNDSDDMMVGFQALCGTNPKPEIVHLAKAVLESDRQNNRKFNPLNKDEEGARENAVKFTRRVAFFSQNQA